MRTSEARSAVDEARAKLATAESELRAVRARRKILCACGKRHAIGKLKLLVTHWYTAPHGCTGGDYWNEGEWQFACPVNDTARNRLLFDDYGVEYDKRSVVGVAAEPTFKSIYRGLFASSANVYDDDAGANFYNNYYADQHREQFELPAKPKRSA